MASHLVAPGCVRGLLVKIDATYEVEVYRVKPANDGWLTVWQVSCFYGGKRIRTVESFGIDERAARECCAALNLEASGR